MIALTPHARSLQERLIDAAQQVNAAATRGFTAEETSLYLELTARAIANLDLRGREGQT